MAKSVYVLYEHWSTSDGDSGITKPTVFESRKSARAAMAKDVIDYMTKEACFNTNGDIREDFVAEIYANGAYDPHDCNPDCIDTKSDVVKKMKTANEFYVDIDSDGTWKRWSIYRCKIQQ